MYPEYSNFSLNLMFTMHQKKLQAQCITETRNPIKPYLSSISMKIKFSPKQFCYGNFFSLIFVENQMVILILLRLEMQ